MSRARAASRFCAWVRCSRLSISSTPSLVMRLPASATSRILDLGRQRRRVDVEAQLHGRRHLVDVLPAGAGRAHEPLVDLAVVEDEGRRDLQHAGC